MTAISPPVISAAKPHLSVVQILQRLRLASGLVLFTYVTSHLMNHIAGLGSLGLMNEARDLFLAPWWWPPLLYTLWGATVVHLSLALWSIFRRRTLKLRRWEMVQLLLGLYIPFQLTEHLVGTRVAFEVYDININYDYVLISLFTDPFKPWIHISMMLAAWLHGCVGLHFWLRFRPLYQKAAPWLYALALLFPVLATISFFQNGREVQVMLERDAAWRQATFNAMRLPADPAKVVADLNRTRDLTRLGLLGILGLTLAARWGRLALDRRHGSVRLRYPGNRQVSGIKGSTILEMSRAANIPHASVCGGRGRCSTCRVRVGKGAEHLPPPDANEARVLERIGAPPTVRLACQTIPTHDLEVTPVLPPNTLAQATTTTSGFGAGREMEIAVLFADLRGFTTLSEQRLPYDIVFLLNRYFAEMGRAIERAGGRVNQFTGDGIMALFGLQNTDPAETANQALNAARYMSERLEVLNNDLKNDLTHPLRMGIGIHQGPCIVGEMGYSTAHSLTAVGDTVNTASRLESLTKEFKAQLVISDMVAKRAGLPVEGLKQDAIILRGRTTPLPIHIAETVAMVAVGK